MENVLASSIHFLFHSVICCFPLHFNKPAYLVVSPPVVQPHSLHIEEINKRGKLTALAGCHMYNKGHNSRDPNCLCCRVLSMCTVPSVRSLLIPSVDSTEALSASFLFWIISCITINFEFQLLWLSLKFKMFA